jgi:hypothetical protein
MCLYRYASIIIKVSIINVWFNNAKNFKKGSVLPYTLYSKNLDDIQIVHDSDTVLHHNILKYDTKC